MGYIRLQPHVQLAAKLVREVGAAQLLQVRQYLRLENGSIRVTEGVEVPDNPVLEKVRQIIGAPQITMTTHFWSFVQP